MVALEFSATIFQSFNKVDSDSTAHPESPYIRRRAHQGRYQIGDEYARSWITSGPAAGASAPNRRAS